MIYINNINPIFFTIGNFNVYYYSLSYILGLFLLPYFVNKNYLKDKILADKFSTYLIIALILCARLGYVLFYSFEYYSENPLKIFAIWEGGMSFHGGFIGIILGVILFCKKYDKTPIRIFDIISIPSAFCLFIGRIMNFVNSELFGRPTDGTWGVIFQRTDPSLILRHPSQIYEALTEGLFLFCILLFLHRKKIFKKDGFLSAIFICGYSFFRFCTEFTRQPDEQLGFVLGFLSMGQILCIVMFIFGIILSFFLMQKNLTYKKT